MRPGNSAVTFKPRYEGYRGQGKEHSRQGSKCKIPEALEALKGSPHDWDKEKKRKEMMRPGRQAGTIGWTEAHGLYSV